MVFVIDDLVVAGALQGAAKIVHGQRAVATEAGGMNEPCVVGAIVSVSNQVMNEIRIPD